jgi:hypothetical protein
MLRIVHPVSKCAHKINNFGEIVGGLSVIANLFGWAETPYWARPHWRDFLFVPRVNKDNPNQSNVK